MRKVLLVVLVFWGNVAAAQSVSLGGDVLGINYYQLRQASSFNPPDVTFEVFAQYTFKDSLFGMECSFLSGYDGLPQPPRFYYPPDAEVANYYNPPETFNITTADYFIYNPFPKNRTILFQLKVGLFYSPFNDDYGNNFADWGPAFGLYAARKIYKRCYLGLDILQMIGIQKYILPAYPGDNYVNGVYQGKTIFPAIVSQVSYSLFQLKFLYKI